MVAWVGRVRCCTWICPYCASAAAAADAAAVDDEEEEEEEPVVSSRYLVWRYCL